MSKIVNTTLKGQGVMTAFGRVEFNDEGISGEVSDELRDAIICLEGYSVLDEEESKTGEDAVTEPGVDKLPPEGENAQEEQSKGVEDENPDENEKSEDGKNSEKDEKSEEIEFEKMNVPQLKKYAKENGIDLMGASKKDEILPIILGASTN